MLTGAVVGGSLDYSVHPPALWVRTDGPALYRLTEPSEAYKSMCRPPGLSPDCPLSEASLKPLLPLFEHAKLEHPFASKKKMVYPSLCLSSFTLCAKDGTPRSLLRSMPDGLRAKNRPADAPDDAVYIRGRLAPAAKRASSPWVWAGPVRAWSIDFEARPRDGRPDPILWLCTAHAAYALRPSEAAGGETEVGGAALQHVSSLDRADRSAPDPLASAASRAWAMGDGLAMRLAGEVLAGCREQADPSRAVKLYNLIMTNAWSRLPQADTAGMQRNAAVYEKHLASFLIQVGGGGARVRPLGLRRTCC